MQYFCLMFFLLFAVWKQSTKANLFTCSWGQNSYRWILLSVCVRLQVFVYTHPPECRSWVHNRTRCPRGPDWRRGQIPLWWAAWCEPATGHPGQTSLTHQYLLPGPHVAAHVPAEERKMAKTEVWKNPGSQRTININAYNAFWKDT